MNLYERLKDEAKEKLDNCKKDALHRNAMKILEQDKPIYNLTISEFSDVMIMFSGIGGCFDAFAFQQLFKD